MSHRTVRTVSFLFILLTIVAFVPGLACTALGFQAAAGVAVLGAVTGMSAAVHGGWRIGLRAAAATGIASALATLVVGQWMAAFLLFLLIGLRLAVAGRNGMWPAYVLVPISAGFVLGEDPSVSAQPVLDAVTIGLLLAASAVFAVLVTHVALRGRTLPRATDLSPGRALAFGLTLGVLLGIAAAIVVYFQLGHTGAWTILTVSIIVQPFIQDGFTKALQRAAGTLLGFVIAILIAVAVPSTTLIYILAVLASVISLAFLVDQRPYWMYATALTVAIVCLEGASTSILDTARDRLIATAIGAALSLLAIAILEPFARRNAHRTGATHY